MIKGQINRGSILGEKVYNLAKRNDVNTIVDIGTFNGMGSTKCIYDAVKGTEKLVYSLECNKDRWEEAKRNLGKLPKNFNLIHGTIVDSNELISILENLKNEIFKDWLRADLAWLESTPNVLNQLPEKIDLCIIDGGEFSGHKEFLKLWQRCRFIVLDDTLTNKHSESRKFILDRLGKFTILSDNLKERNGFLICEYHVRLYKRK